MRQEFAALEAGEGQAEEFDDDIPIHFDKMNPTVPEYDFIDNDVFITNERWDGTVGYFGGDPNFNDGDY